MFRIGWILPLVVLCVGLTRPTRAQIDTGPITGPIVRDIDTGFRPPEFVTVPLGTYNFDGCTPQTWTSHDLGDIGPYFHVDDFAGLSAPLSPIAGTKSLWCGARPSTTAGLCSYLMLPGYGDEWDESWITKSCLTVSGDVTISFQAKYDTEANYDNVFIEYDHCDDTWFELGTLTGVSGVVSVSETILAFFHSGQVRFRIRFESDGAYSDEDGLYNSNGAAIIDALQVSDAGGIKVSLENFESTANGATQTTAWRAEPNARGNFAGVVAGSALLQQDPVTTNLSCMWAFIVGSAANYGCGGFPSQAAVPFIQADAHIDNEIWSPWLPMSGPLTYATKLRFQVYADLPQDNQVFYQVHVRERLSVSGCPTAWVSNGFVYYSERKRWMYRTIDLTPLLSPTATSGDIQVAIGVVDMIEFWGTTYGSGACHSHAPLIDNIDVFRWGTRSHIPRGLSLFQDRFPDNGGMQETVRIDGIDSDLLSIQITQPGPGIDFLLPNNPQSGPAVFCHVKNLGNKSGAVVSGGQQWPVVQSMSNQTWTVLQMSVGTEPHEYQVDLNDNLYQPGDVVQYYISSRAADGQWSYWSNFTDEATEADVQAYPMEVTALPYPPLPNDPPRALYVDGCSGLGAQPYIESAMDQIGMDWDRFDRNEPAEGLKNGLGNLMPLALLQQYDVVIWNTGDVPNPFMHEDYAAMLQYLQGTPGARLYISGDHAASAIAASQDQSAIALRTGFINFLLKNDNHVSEGLSLSPLTSGSPNGPLQESFYVFGGGESTGPFDVMAPTGASNLGMYYGNSSSEGAIVYQETNGQFGPVKTVLSGFSFHDIRDDQPEGLPDRTRHLNEILAYFGMAGNPTTASPVPVRDMLEQNAPNPFNPSTTIAYSQSQPGTLSLRIYDVGGRLVRTLADEVRPAGPGRALWNGRDDAGHPVASGVYFYRLTAPGFTATRKLVLLK